MEIDEVRRLVEKEFAGDDSFGVSSEDLETVVFLFERVPEVEWTLSVRSVGEHLVLELPLRLSLRGEGGEREEILREVLQLNADGGLVSMRVRSDSLYLDQALLQNSTEAAELLGAAKTIVRTAEAFYPRFEALGAAYEDP